MWGATRRRPGRTPVLVAGVEHSAVARRFARAWPRWCTLAVDGAGRIDPDAVAEAIERRAARRRRPGPRPLPGGQPRSGHPPAGGRGRRAAAHRHGVAVHVDACADGRAPPRWPSTSSAPTSCRSAPTSWAARPAWARSSSAAGCASIPCWSAANRNGPGGPGSRTSPPSSVSAPPPTPSPPPVVLEAEAADGPAADEPAAAGGHRGRRRRTALGDPDARVPHIVCVAVDGRRGRARPARPRPERHRRPLRLVVLVGVPGALARARGHGRGRRTLACACRWVGRPPTTTSRRSRRPSPGGGAVARSSDLSPGAFSRRRGAVVVGAVEVETVPGMAGTACRPGGTPRDEGPGAAPRSAEARRPGTGDTAHRTGGVAPGQEHRPQVQMRRIGAGLGAFAPPRSCFWASASTAARPWTSRPPRTRAIRTRPAPRAVLGPRRSTSGTGSERRPRSRLPRASRPGPGCGAAGRRCSS